MPMSWCPEVLQRTFSYSSDDSGRESSGDDDVFMEACEDSSSEYAGVDPASTVADNLATATQRFCASQLPKNNAARTNVESTAAEPVGLDLPAAEQAFDVEEQDFWCAPRALPELIEDVAREMRALAMFTAGPEASVIFALTQVVTRQ